MHIRRLLVPVALFGLVLASAGCIRDYQRRGSTRAVPSSAPREMAQLPPVPAPAPPTPPPLPKMDPPVTPPRSDSVTGIIPPMPAAEADSQPVSTTAGEELIAADGRPPIRDRLEELRKKLDERREERKEKREEKREERKDPPSPFAPKTVEPKADGSKLVPAGGASPDLSAVRTLIEASAKKWEAVPDFEARLIKKEVVNGKQMPTDELIYRYRRDPMSIYMKTLSEAGKGREVMYVKGEFGDKLHVVTGKGDNALVGTGYKTELDPDSRLATQRSRHKVTEAGFGRAINGLKQAMAAVEAGKPVGLKALGPVKRSEYPYPLEAIEMTLKPGPDPSMPKGGKRMFYFDPKPESPSHLLPVLVTAQEPDGREVEYYCFDRFRLPANIPDRDWHPDRLGK